MAADPGITIVVPTFNRADRLEHSLRSLLILESPPQPYDIIVVDNGSTDGTAEVVSRFAAGCRVPVRCLREPRAGVSWARNAAIRSASAPILAFMDDDQDVAPDWLIAIARAFREYPDVDVIGGRVLPRWLDSPPGWISPEAWGPVSIIDRGTEPYRVSKSRWMCLPGGNMAWRRNALLALGGFSVDYARTEDRELLVRHLLAGGQAMYVPSMVVHHRLDGGRLTRAFFRSWYRTEGRIRAGYAFEELLTADGGLRARLPEAPQVLGVARYLYREWLGVLVSFLAALLTFRPADAIRLEGRLLLLSAYIRRRIQLTATPEASLLHRLSALAVRAET